MRKGTGRLLTLVVFTSCLLHGGDPSIRVAGVKSIKTLKSDGGRLSWSKSGDWIAYDRRGDDGFYDLFKIRVDGSSDVCLTCNSGELPGKHTGNPEWHPSGDYIVFQAQKTFPDLGAANFYAQPGFGIQNDLWVTNSQGSSFWRLRRVPFGFGGVLHPHFSNKGDLLVWAERISASGPPPGQWAIKVSDFSVRGGIPGIENIRTYRPGRQRQFYETHGFSPDDKLVYFSANPFPGQRISGIDILTYNLSTGEMTNLTRSPLVWDEHAQPSPDGELIVWDSSRGSGRSAKTDYWLMTADGVGQVRLTYFNEVGHSHYIEGGVHVADNDWSPNGQRLAAYLITDTVDQSGKIVIIDLLQSPPRNPMNLRRRLNTSEVRSPGGRK